MRANARRICVLSLTACVATSILPGPIRIGRAVFADDADALRQGLLAGTKATWPETMDAIGRSATLVGSIVGPLLRDLDRTRLPATAFAAAWLCEHPAGARVLLDEEIVRRGASDPEFVGALRASLSIDGAGWSRIVAAARSLLQSPSADASLAAAAATFLGAESTASNVRDLLEAWQRADATSDVRGAAKAAFERVLGASFHDPDAARTFLDEHRGSSLFEWVRELSIAKDRPDAPTFRRLLKEVAANLTHVTKPDELAPYLDVEQTPWPEVRRLAAEHSASIDPKAEGWGRLLQAAVFAETDAITLETLLRSAARVGLTGAAGTPEQVTGAKLAEEAEERLCSRPAPSDALAIGFLSILARVGRDGHVGRVFKSLTERRASDAVLAAWLDAAAASGGASPAVRELHRSRRSSREPAGLELRMHALAALAKGGAESAGEAAANAVFLAELLVPPPAGDAGFTPSGEERAAAARALEAFPVPASVAALAAQAGDPTDPQLARLAASVLGRLASKEARDPSAPRTGALPRLIVLAREPGDSAVRASAFGDLARLAADGVELDAETVAACQGAVRDTLESSAALDVRRAAARAAAAMGDTTLLRGVLEVVAADVSQGGETVAGAQTALEAAGRLVRVLAAAEPPRQDENDAVLARLLRGLFDTGPQGATAAIELAAAAADAGGARFPIQVLRATLLARRATSAPIDRRVADLDEARRLLGSALKTAPQAGSPAGAGLVEARALDRDVARRLLSSLLAQSWPVVFEGAPPPPDETLLERRRALDAAIRAVRADFDTSRALVGASELDAALLQRLRVSPSDPIRRAALVDSARVELAGPRGAEAIARARAYVDGAKALSPTPAEAAELAAIEAGLAGGADAPPTPK